MNILGLSGSPHEKGNTAFAVGYALEKVPAEHETRYISLAGKTIHPCIACFKCSTDPTCVFTDDMTEIYEALRWCDALILGSPVYMGMVAGQVKILMDRCVLLRPSYEKPLELSGKIGCGIACGEFRNGGQETTLQNIQTFMLQQNMRVISDGFPYCHSGGTIVSNAKDDTLGLSTIDALVKNLLSYQRNPT